MPDFLDFCVRFIIFAALHSISAIQTIKNLAQQILGDGYRFYRIGYNAFSLVLLSWVMAAYRNSPVLYFIPGTMSLFLYLAQGIIIILIVCCTSRTGLSNFIGLDQIRGQNSIHILITSRCYSKVRHPQYSLATVFLICNPVMTRRWLIFTLLSFGYFVLGSIIEEKRLIEEFGEEYLAYKNTVPMFIPQLKLKQ